MYGKLIINYLFAFKFDICVEISLKIIRSIGVQRGKNDKVDAERIAYYAMKNVEETVCLARGIINVVVHDKSIIN